MGKKKPGRRGRGAEGKTPAGGLSRAHMQVVDGAGGLCLSRAAAKSVGPGSTRVTDGRPSYRRLTASGSVHEPRVQEIPGARSRFCPGCTWSSPTSSAQILAVFHGVSPKHLQSYLDEFCYRLNRRYAQTDLFRPIVHSCVRLTEPVTYAQLTAS